MSKEVLNPELFTNEITDDEFVAAVGDLSVSETVVPAGTFTEGSADNPNTSTGYSWGPSLTE